MRWPKVNLLRNCEILRCLKYLARPHAMKVVGDVVLTDSQGSWSLVSEVQSQVKPAVSPAPPHLKLQELRDVETQTDRQGG